MERASSWKWLASWHKIQKTWICCNTAVRTLTLAGLLCFRKWEIIVRAANYYCDFTEPCGFSESWTRFMQRDMAKIISWWKSSHRCKSRGGHRWRRVISFANGICSCKVWKWGEFHMVFIISKFLRYMWLLVNYGKCILGLPALSYQEDHLVPHLLSGSTTFILS